MGYNFGTSYSTKEWDAARGSTDLDAILFGLEDNALLTEFGCGTDGNNTFTLHINTSSTVDDTAYTRNSAWRKAYRFINRFDLGTINMDQRINGKLDKQSTYKVSRSFAKNTVSFEVPIDHKPPCRFPLHDSSNPTGSRPLVEMIYSMTLLAGTAGDLLDDPISNWSIGSTGLQLIENSTPESIEFTLLKSGTPPFQKIDTSTSIVPAYSGEILSFQDAGYMENVQEGGMKIFIDITQTDEVLRWDPETDIKPEEYWLDTFSSIQVKNDNRRSFPKITFKKNTLEVVSNDKDNYVVSFHNDTATIPVSKWLNGDTIRTEFKRKKTIVFGDNRAPWDGSVYENIQYRSLNDEFQDDPWVQAPIEPPIETGACCINGVCEQKFEVECGQLGGQFFGVGSTDCTDCGDDGGNESSEILPFTITLNGTLDDGTVTINYPSGFNATGITFEVYIEKDPDLS